VKKIESRLRINRVTAVSEFGTRCTVLIIVTLLQKRCRDTHQTGCTSLSIGGTDIRTDGRTDNRPLHTARAASITHSARTYIGAADFHRAMVATAPGGKLLVDGAPCEELDPPYDIRLVFVRRIAFVLRKINKNCRHQSCTF